MNHSRHDHADFEQETVPHMDALYAHALRLTGNREDADDLLQETYMKAFRFFHSFQKGTNCKAWLFQIMKNTFINRYREKKRMPGGIRYEEIEEQSGAIHPEEDSLRELERALFENRLGDEVSKALQTLPEIFRTILLLSDIEDMTYEEIAEVMDCPVGTVRSRLHRARKAMYAALQTYARERGITTNTRFQ